MIVKIKKFVSEAVIPSYALNGDCGMDMTATSKEYDENGNIVYGTGIGVSIPEGYVGFVFPRSSNAKKDLLLSNSVGIIDSNYVGEIMFKFKIIPMMLENSTIDESILLDNYEMNDYNIGDRIAQLVIMPYPKVEFEVVNELPVTERGVGSYGSTGN